MDDDEDYMLERYDANRGYPGARTEEEDTDTTEATTDEDNEEDEKKRKKKIQQQQVFLLVGHSGGGKTTLSQDLIRSILGDKKPRVLLVNDNTGKKPPRGWKKVEWAQLEDERDAAVVFEDVVSTSRVNFDRLKSVIHHHNHHR